jgi:hypothetical protein
MAMRRPRKPPRATGGKPPIRTNPPRFKTINGVKKRFTGKGRLGVGLGLRGKGKRITNKGYTGKGRRGYGQGNHGIKQHATAKPGASGAATPKAPGRIRRTIRRTR